MQLSLRNKLLFAILGSSIVPILLICVFLSLSIRDKSLETFAASTGSELKHIDKAISIFIDETRANTSLLARSPAVRAVDGSINSFIRQTEKKATSDLEIGPVEAKVLELTRTLLATHSKTFVDVYVGTEQGGFSMASNAPLPPGYDPRARPWYREALQNSGKPIISKAYQSTTGDAVLTATETVNRDGKIVGVVGIDVTLGGLTEFIKSIKIGETGYVMLIQDDGVVLADPRIPENNFKKLNELGEDAYSAMNKSAGGSLSIELKGKSYVAQVLTSPGLGWKLVGLIERSEIMADVYGMLYLVGGIGLGIGAIFIAVGFFLAASLAKPIVRTTQMIRDVAEGEGDLTKRLEVSSKDELGMLATWFNSFLDNLQKIISEIGSHAGVVEGSSGKLLQIATQLSANAGDSSEKAENVAAASNEMSQSMNKVSATVEETTNNTGMVAAAVEEMSATINEIAGNSEKARTISERAVAQAQGASGKMGDLGDAARAISAVTETITEISEQTNLLALNATIEAARAGEAGKGFAVVANEIKELAKQTADATADIKAKIEGVQGTTQETVAEIESIGTVINEINEIIATIATAIEEQSVATSEISENVTQASSGMEEVNISIAESTSVIDEINLEVAAVNNSASEIRGNSTLVEDNAQELKRLSDELNRIIGRFRY